MAEYTILRRLMWLIISLLLLAGLLTGNVYGQEPTMVSRYGCAALYTTDEPVTLAHYMTELIEYQPMITDLTSYVEALPEEKCSNFDLGRMIFNVCGEFGDKNEICEDWKKSYPKFYGNEVIYNYYVATIKASQEGNNSQKVQTDLGEALKRTQPQETASEPTSSGGINIIQIGVAVIALAFVGFVVYNLRMRQSTPNKRPGDPYNDGR